MTTQKSLKTLAAKVKLDTKYGANMAWDKQDEWKQNANGYHCTLRYQGRQFSFDFWMGFGCKGEPTAETCLESLLSDSQAGEQTFEEFCSEMGYDADSRKAEAIWKACQKIAVGMKRLLGDDFEAFLYADRS